MTMIQKKIFLKYLSSDKDLLEEKGALKKAFPDENLSLKLSSTDKNLAFSSGNDIEKGPHFCQAQPQLQLIFG